MPECEKSLNAFDFQPQRFAHVINLKNEAKQKKNALKSVTTWDRLVDLEQISLSKSFSLSHVSSVLINFYLMCSHLDAEKILGSVNKPYAMSLS